MDDRIRVPLPNGKYLEAGTNREHEMRVDLLDENGVNIQTLAIIGQKCEKEGSKKFYAKGFYTVILCDYNINGIELLEQYDVRERGNTEVFTDHQLEIKDRVDRTLNSIEQGELTVRWNEWSFGGGWGGNWQEYELLDKTGRLFGYIQIGEDDTICIIFRNSKVKSVYGYEFDFEKSKSIVEKALIRDDKEIVSICREEDGNIYLPTGSYDIKREFFIQGTMKGEGVWQIIECSSNLTRAGI